MNVKELQEPNDSKSRTAKVPWIEMAVEKRERWRIALCKGKRVEVSMDLRSTQ